MKRGLLGRLGHARRLVAAGFVAFASLLSCGREITGPANGVRYARNLSFVAEFPGLFASVETGSGAVVDFEKVRVIFRRLDGSVALVRTVNFPSNATQVTASFDVPLSGESTSTGEELDLFLRYVNAAGDTVFAGGPSPVLAVPGRATPPEPTVVPLTYTGPGATATSIAVSPDTVTVEAGAPFGFSAEAQDAQGAAVPAAPILWFSLDPTRAPLSDPSAGTGTAAATRGTVLVRASLVTGVAADTAVLVITPRPQALTLLEGGAQTGATSAPLATPIRVRLTATDGLGIAGQELAVLPGNGGSVPDSSVVTDSAGVVTIPWTLGAATGAQSLTFSYQGLPNLVVTATAATPTSSAVRLEFQPPAPDTVFSGVNVVPAPIVFAVDALGVRDAAFTGTVTLELIGGPPEGILTGTLAVVADTGVATFNAVSGTLIGSYLVRAVAAGLTPDTLAPLVVVAGMPDTILVIQGDGQTGYTNDPLPTPIIVEVRDAVGNVVPGVPVGYSVATGGGSVVGSGTVTDSTGRATIGTWTLGPTAGENTLDVGVEGASNITLTATAENPPPEIVMNVVGSSVVGVGRTGTIRVRLLQPAPVNDFLVTLTSDSTQYLTFVEGNVLAFQAGQTELPIEVNGVAVGNGVLRAVATGYTSDTLVVPVSLNLITLPPTLNVPLAQTASLPVSLSAPAPAGGVNVAVTSSNPGILQPVLDTVFIPAGQTSVNVNIEGLALGAATLTATNPNYAQDETAASVTAGVDLTATTYSINASFGTTATVRLVSGASAVAAPPGGITVALSADNPACVGVPASVFIAQGLTQTTVPVNYGGSAATPCSTFLRATGPAGFTPDSATVNTAATPVANLLTTFNIGSGLQRGSTLTLGASNHGGTTVRIQSADPAVALVSPDVDIPGTEFIDLPVAVGATTVGFVIQGVEGVTSDTVNVFASAPGFLTDSIAVRVWQPVYQIIGLNGSATTLSIDDVFQVRVGTPTDPAGNLSSVDEIRAGGDTIRISVVNDTPGLGTFVRTEGLSDSTDMVLPPGEALSPSTVAAGGIAFRALAAGTATVRASNNVYRAANNVLINVAITQPVVTTLTTMNLGAGLQRAGTVGVTNGSTVPVDVQLSFDQPGVALLAANSSDIGSDTITVTIPVGVTAVNFWVNALEGFADTTLTLTATSPGFTQRTSAVQIFQPVFEISGLVTSATTLSPDDAFTVRFGTPNTSIGGLSSLDALRPGAPPLVVDVINDTPALGDLVRTEGSSDSTRFVLGQGVNATPAQVASGGVAFRFLGEGTATVRANAQGMRSTAPTQNINITQPSINSLSNINVGAGLQRPGTVTLSQPPTDTVRVTLTTDQVGIALVAPDDATLGADTLVIVFPPGVNNRPFVVQALEGTLDSTITLQATAPGFTGRTSTLRVLQPVVEVVSLATGPTSLDVNDPFAVRVGTPLSPTGGLNSVDELRVGSPGAPIVVRSSLGTVGRLITETGTGDSVLVVLAARASQTPASAALGGVEFDPLTTGTTVVSASIAGFRTIATSSVTVNVVAPQINLSTNGIGVGSGLQLALSGSLNTTNHGGRVLVLRSSNPAVALFQPNRTTAATDSILITISPGTSGFSYYIAGVEGATGSVTVTASTTGFLDGTTPIDVHTPAIRVNTTLVATGTAGVSIDDPFTVSIGVPNATQTDIQSLQSIRAGQSLTVTVSSSEPTIGDLVTTLVPLGAGSVAVVIAADANQSPTSVAAGGVAFRFLTAGTTTVSATAPGFLQVTNGQRVVTVSPAP
ncbi:MAG: hypothetical protein KF709_05690 [Gemmatimonadaceae bacterium]|nr:hypothetical protein [Gemmatimonadaceae bacterium]